ncbi:MAG: FecR domain-containing protein [candidate division KSB1 bacterium]|nr:FecR domain-containing protein [candidate division KSB1 bacterium]
MNHRHGSLSASAVLVLFIVAWVLLIVSTSRAQVTSTVTVPGDASFRSYGYGGLFCGPGGAPVDVGLNLSGLDTCMVAISASGSVVAAGQASHNPDGMILSGTYRAAGGVTYGPGSCVPGSKAARGLPVPSGCFGSLIGLFVGEKLEALGRPFQVGSSAELSIPKGARRLLLAVNDDGYCDNGGAFQVTAQLQARELLFSPLGMLRAITGQVWLSGFGAMSGTPAYHKDRIATGANGSAQADLSNGYQVRTASSTDFTLEISASAACELQTRGKMNKGEGFFKRLKRLLRPPSKFEIHTPTCGVGVRGTAFSVSVDSTGPSTVVTVFEDTVDILSSSDGEVLATLWATGDGHCQRAVIDSAGVVHGPVWVDGDSADYSFPPYQEVPPDTLPPELFGLTDQILPGGTIRLGGRVRDDLAPACRVYVTARPGRYENVLQPVALTGPNELGEFSLEVTLMDGSRPASVLLAISDPAHNVAWHDLQVPLARHTWFVDSANVSGIEDGSAEHPFNTVQEGINAAGLGDTVRVAAGTYREHLEVGWDSDVTLVGAGPSRTVVWPQTYAGAALRVGEQSKVAVQRMAFHGADCGIDLGKKAGLRLENFLIEYCRRGLNTSGIDAEIDARRGRISHCQIGVHGGEHLPIRLTNILFERIGLDHAGDAGVVADGTVEIVNCTFGEHYGEDYSVPAIEVLNGPVTIRNTIIWNCGWAVKGKTEECQVEYSCFGGLEHVPGAYYRDCSQGGTNLRYGTNPLFVAPHYPDYDYHLLPTSPCIDAGDPSDDYSLEPEPNGGRIDMGAYGNTAEATPSGLGAVLFLPDTSVQSGASVVIPVTVSTDSSIALAQFVIDFDSACVAFVGAQVGADAPGFAVSSVNDNLPFAPEGYGPLTKNVLVQISGGGAACFSGSEKRVVLLQFTVLGAPGWMTWLRFDTRPSHCFLTTSNLTDIGAGNIRFRHGSVSVLNEFAISGQVSYCTSARPVPQAQVLVDGQLVATTDYGGSYLIPTVLAGTYSLGVQKTGDLRGAISGADALALLRHLAFLPPPLNQCQLRAGDLTEDGNISGADAIALLRYLAFFTTGTGRAGTWVFEPDAAVVSGPPDTRQEFVANLLGDVTQNWTSSPPGLERIGPVASETSLPTESENVGAQWTTKAKVILPDTTIVPGSKVVLPILVTTDSVIALAQFVINYDSTAIRVDSVRVGRNAANFFLRSNTSLPFSASFPNGKNLLVQVWSADPSQGFTGDSAEVALLHISGIGTAEQWSPLVIDSEPERTFLTTPNLYDIRAAEILFIPGRVTLPVELISFQAQFEHNRVRLNWIAAAEHGAFAYEVERSRDNVTFVTIGRVNAQTSGREATSYEFVDFAAASGVTYYRLKQLHHDGTMSYSAPIRVDIPAPRAFQLHQNYPNPFNMETTIRYELARRTRIVLIVSDPLGREVRRLVQDSHEPGYYSAVWDGRDDFGRDLPSGVYFLRLSGEGFAPMVRKAALIK